MRRPADFTDPDRLRGQYADSDRFRVRVETH